MFALSVLGFVRSITARDDATLMENLSDVFFVWQLNFSTLHLLPMLMAGCQLGVGIDVHGIHVISLAARSG